MLIDENLNDAMLFFDIYRLDKQLQKLCNNETKQFKKVMAQLLKNQEDYLLDMSPEDKSLLYQAYGFNTHPGMIRQSLYNQLYDFIKKFENNPSMNLFVMPKTNVKTDKFNFHASPHKENDIEKRSKNPAFNTIIAVYVPFAYSGSTNKKYFYGSIANTPNDFIKYYFN